jgi:hypothetical protein
MKNEAAVALVPLMVERYGTWDTVAQAGAINPMQEGISLPGALGVISASHAKSSDRMRGCDGVV